MPDDATPNPFDDLPIEADTLTALIEGELDGNTAHEVRERLLKADPELAQRVELMARDRVMLRTLGDETPPEGLGDEIIAQLEREALLGLRAGEPSTGSLPIARMARIHHRRTRRQGSGRWLTRPAGAGLAVAALLVLAAGVVLQLVPNSTPPAPGPVASAETDDTPLAVASETTSPAPVVAADVPDAPAALAAKTAAGDAAPAEIAEAAPVTGELFTDDWGRALALLDEGRLLVRVRSASPEATLARLEPLAARAPRAGQAWRLEDGVTEPIATAMQQKFAPTAVDTTPLRLAADAGPAEPLVDRSHLQPARSAMAGLYLVDARRDTAAMASLNAALSLGDGQVAVFEELTEPLELPRVLTPEAVLWWSRPASSWVERRYVPVVIERVER